ncbi:MAG: FAD-dependent oxidoreductase [Deltaproteobacteria bacterium]|nr:FAD-dependent oxidoreductase [Deltaproteobacteria bacterium]
MIKMQIDGQEVSAQPDSTVLEACRSAGIQIPTLCYHKSLSPYGACRLCLVEIEERGRPRIRASCVYPVEEGLVVHTNTDKVRHHRRMMAELLLARCPGSAAIRQIAADLGVEEARFPQKDEDCILCGLCVRVCEEKMGIGAVDFSARGSERKVGPAYDRKSPVCMACGACESICPMEKKLPEAVSSRAVRPSLAGFDAGLTRRSSIYIPFQQAVPNVPVIDRDTCAHFLTGGGCKTCLDFCEAGAIDFGQQDEQLALDVGAVIVSPGFELFDHALRSEYGFGLYPNVISSLQLERVLSASGPYRGHLQRPVDGKVPDRMAFIQCVGSREADANFCSSVCCMYAVKHALMAREHCPDLACTIFYMDMRAFGKGFDAYYQRAVDDGVRFVRARPANVQEVGEGKNLLIRYQDESGEFRSEEFDLVILSCGMRPSEDNGMLAERLGIGLDERGFCRTEAFDPMRTSRPGVFVCGAFSEPKDIPETVIQASGAAAKSMALLAEARGTMVSPKAYPPERDVTGEEPRIGVFVCHCGRNIGSVVNVPEVVAYAEELPDVVYATDNLFTCSQDTQELIKKVIADEKLNRVVVASCTPRTHEPLFRDTVREAGLNRYLFEMANIRDQCSWVHMHEPQAATSKAKDLVRMAIAKARLLEPLQERSMSPNHEALVIGGGVAGMSAAIGLADQGFQVHLVEREPELGGHARHVHFLPRGEEPKAFLAERIDRVTSHPRIKLYLGSVLKSVEGFVGRFTSTIVTNGTQHGIEHGVVIVATGAGMLETEEYLYGKDERVISQVAFESELAAGECELDNVVMIQCVGSRDDERPYCSRLCCNHAIRNALKLKELKPQANVFVLYRDVRAYGFREQLYTLAREKGVRFIRYEPERKPEVSQAGEKLRVEVDDPILQSRLAIDCDRLVLSLAVVPREDTENLAKMLKVPINQEKFYLEAHMKLRPVDFASEGIFLCGLAHSPKDLSETVAQAMGAAGRASTILANEELPLESAISEVVDANCDGCAYCIDPCPYDALTLLEYKRKGEIKKTVQTNEALCKGCGVCQATCPKQGIFVRSFKLDQLNAMVEAALEMG